MLLSIITISTFTSAQNLVINSGFENNVSEYTVLSGGRNLLKRVSVFQDDVNQSVSPVAPVDPIKSGQWVIRTFVSGYIKAAVVTSDKHEGNNSLSISIRQGSAQKNLEYWYGTTILQKLVTPLSNAKKYKVSVWAKADEVTNNQCDKITIFFTDDSSKLNFTSVINLTGGTAWTKYEVILDVPSFVKRYKSTDFSTTFFGVGITTNYDEDSKSLYSGVHLDDFTLTEE
jgi:hypothetical protein